MVDLAELVGQLMCQLVEAAKLWPALHFFDRIEEGLDGLLKIFHHAGTIKGLVVRIFGQVLLAQT